MRTAASSDGLLIYGRTVYGEMLAWGTSPKTHRTGWRGDGDLDDGLSFNLFAFFCWFVGGHTWRIRVFDCGGKYSNSAWPLHSSVSVCAGRRRFYCGLGMFIVSGWEASPGGVKWFNLKLDFSCASCHLTETCSDNGQPIFRCMSLHVVSIGEPELLCVCVCVLC